MKYIKTYEKILNKNIQIGRFYRIGHIHINGEKVFPIVKLLDKDSIALTVKGYFEDSREVCKFRIRKSSFTNIASPEEIKKFEQYELIEMSNKYNI